MVRRRLRRLPYVVAVLILAAVGAAWLLRNGGREVEVAMPVRGLAVEAVYATGTVEPEKWAKISPLVSGRIAEILVGEGDRVVRGQPLARLDDREASARVAELEAKASYWAEEMRRQTMLADRGVKSREAEQKARSEYNQVLAAISAARQRRADLMVTSPIDGVVIRRDFELGEVVGLDDAVFWVGAPRPLRVTADVDEEDIARVHPGQKVLIKADAFPDRVLEGRIDRLTPKGDPVNKTFRVRVALPDDTPLMVGMTTEINVVTAEKPGALLIPATAVGGGRVLVVEAGVAAERPVKLGIRGRTTVEVVDGLTGTEPVIANPPAGLKPGDRVRAKG
jgi:RND family efflux transporter MFP subunit